MTNNEKSTKIEKLTKELTDFLNKCGLHYRIIIPAKDNSMAVECSNMTNVEVLTDVVAHCLKIIRESGVSRENFLKLLNEMLTYAEEAMEDDNE